MKTVVAVTLFAVAGFCCAYLVSDSANATSYNYGAVAFINNTLRSVST
jgi:hypothetical protein